MNVMCSDKNAALLEGSLGIPTESGFLLKSFRAKRKEKWKYFLPLCMAFVAYLCLACPGCLFAFDKLNSLDYETALQHGKEAQRPLLIFFTSPWCYQCTEMERKVFQNKDIVALLNERFVLVEVDISQEKRLKENFLISYTPTTLFLDTQGGPIIDVKGYVPVSRFRKLLRYVSEGYYKTISFSDFEKI